MKAMRGLIGAVIVATCSAASGGQEQPRRIPVLAWIGPPAEQANAARYRELAECGFTHSFSGFANAAEMARALDAARDADVKLMVSCPELRSDPQTTVRRFQDHPALGGYFLQEVLLVGKGPERRCPDRLSGQTHAGVRSRPPG